MNVVLMGVRTASGLTESARPTVAHMVNGRRGIVRPTVVSVLPATSAMDAMGATAAASVQPRALAILADGAMLGNNAAPMIRANGVQPAIRTVREKHATNAIGAALATGAMGATVGMHEASATTKANVLLAIPVPHGMRAAMHAMGHAPKALVPAMSAPKKSSARAAIRRVVLPAPTRSFSVQRAFRRPTPARAASFRFLF